MWDVELRVLCVLAPQFPFALSLQAYIREAQAEVIQTRFYNLFKKTVQPNSNYSILKSLGSIPLCLINNYKV
jgi:hypothetical protein